MIQPALDVIAGKRRWSAIRARSHEALKLLPRDSVHSGVEDPPAWIDFMNKAWDSSDAYRDFEAVMVEHFRVLRPGGHILVWAIPRTSHLTAIAIERAGFEIRDRVHDLAAADPAFLAFLDSLTDEQVDALGRLLDSQASASSILLHLFGQGFPKSANIATLIDKANGVKPIRIEAPSLGMATGPNRDQWNELKRRLIMPPPTTPDAKKWAGWGTALKPAAEHWILARKPFKGSVNRNVIRYETGALNINATRVKHNEECRPLAAQHDGEPHEFFRQGGRHTDTTELKPQGRWPAHVVLEHSPACMIVGEATIRSEAATEKASGKPFSGHPERAEHPYSEEHEETDLLDMGEESDEPAKATETVPVWECVLGCPVRVLDRQSAEKMHGAGSARAGEEAVAGGAYNASSYHTGSQPREMFRLGDEGGAARFFYQAKAALSEKDAGCDKLQPKTAAEMTGRKEGSAGLVMTHEDGRPKANAYAGTSGGARRNHHPTVKSVTLMRWLVRLVTPANGIVLDPFMGSGTTGVAALMEGLRFIGFDRDEDKNGQPLGYVDIACARCEHAAGDPMPVAMPVTLTPTNSMEAALGL